MLLVSYHARMVCSMPAAPFLAEVVLLLLVPINPAAVLPYPCFIIASCAQPHIYRFLRAVPSHLSLMHLNLAHTLAAVLSRHNPLLVACLNSTLLPHSITAILPLHYLHATCFGLPAAHALAPLLSAHAARLASPLLPPAVDPSARFAGLLAAAAARLVPTAIQ